MLYGDAEYADGGVEDGLDDAVNFCDVLIYGVPAARQLVEAVALGHEQADDAPEFGVVGAHVLGVGVKACAGFVDEEGPVWAWFESAYVLGVEGGLRDGGEVLPFGGGGGCLGAGRGLGARFDAADGLALLLSAAGFLVAVFCVVAFFELFVGAPDDVWALFSKLGEGLFGLGAVFAVGVADFVEGVDQLACLFAALDAGGYDVVMAGVIAGAFGEDFLQLLLAVWAAP